MCHILTTGSRSHFLRVIICTLLINRHSHTLNSNVDIMAYIPQGNQDEK